MRWVRVQRSNGKEKNDNMDDWRKDKRWMSFKMAFKRLMILVIRKSSKQVGSSRKENVGVAMVNAFSYLNSKRVTPKWQSSSNLKFNIQATIEISSGVLTGKYSTSRQSECDWRRDVCSDCRSFFGFCKEYRNVQQATIPNMTAVFNAQTNGRY